ncbi:tryptophan 7-halogenase [Paraglaciecola aquimarina]|uniref:Tryptophan 7-halogenase n=1 Tax=Paraglaciecola algarum TaxID=3050085 RepID=A0ABS9DBF4_9ALTE|nr:tryptophan halogenase family protein [Paraglaciecola sp. G1-23]MCF2950263.1 tryptophan 7-halogenase [Paraglaciecola sp. G1-23]
MAETKKKIVVLGGGTAGWVTASILSKNLAQANYTVTLIESDTIQPVGVGEASIPPIYSLIEYLELNDSDLIAKVDGSFKYGIHFENWSKPGEQYMHAFGELGTKIGQIPFLDFWFRTAHKTGSTSITPFFPTAVAAYNNKFAPPAPRPSGAKANDFFPLCNLSYALHFDASLMAKYLQDFSVKNGITHITGTVANVQLTAAGDIASVQLENGETFEGDLFIDCSGSSGRLIKQVLKQDIQDWSAYLPSDRAIAVQIKNESNSLPSYTKAIAMQAGWRWQIPLQTRTGNGYVYCSKYISDQEAQQELMSQLDGEAITEPRIIPFKTGCLTEPWYKNCVAIGLSSGFMEPMESTSIHLIYRYALLLREQLDADNWHDSKMFNTTFAFQTQGIRDFLVLHYHVNQRDDSKFWRDCQKMALPKELELRLEEYSRTGYINIDPRELFSFESWVQILIGQKYLDSYERFSLPGVSAEAATQVLKNVYSAIQNEVAKLPEHNDFINNLKIKQQI